MILIRAALGLPFGTVRGSFGLLPLVGVAFPLLSLRVVAQAPRVLSFAGRERWRLAVRVAFRPAIIIARLACTCGLRLVATVVAVAVFASMLTLIATGSLVVLRLLAASILSR